MSSKAEKLERKRSGPHKEPVDIYGIDEDGKQKQIVVTTDGKQIVRVTGLDEDGVQRTLLLSSDGKMVGRTEPLIQSEYDRTCTRDASGRITQIVITDGVRTKTMNVARNGAGRITAIDETVT